jgi:hypothetical protein
MHKVHKRKEIANNSCERIQRPVALKGKRKWKSHV